MESFSLGFLQLRRFPGQSLHTAFESQGFKEKEWLRFCGRLQVMDRARKLKNILIHARGHATEDGWRTVIEVCFYLVNTHLLKQRISWGISELVILKK